MAQESTVLVYCESKAHFYPPSGGRPPFSVDMIDTSIITDINLASTTIGYEMEFSYHPEKPLLSRFFLLPLSGYSQKETIPKLGRLKKKSGGRIKLLKKNNHGPGKPFTGPGTAGPSTAISGFLAYYEIKDLIKKKALTSGIDSRTETAEAYHLITEEWVSFDTPESSKQKAEFARKKSLGGVMCWAINLDEYYWEPRFPIIREAWEVFFPPDQ